jgi:hypothetical protein
MIIWNCWNYLLWTSCSIAMCLITESKWMCVHFLVCANYTRSAFIYRGPKSDDPLSLCMSFHIIHTHLFERGHSSYATMPWWLCRVSSRLWYDPRLNWYHQSNLGETGKTRIYNFTRKLIFLMITVITKKFCTACLALRMANDKVTSFFFCDPNLFVICTITFSKLCKTYTITCIRVLYSALL